jgi:hypothetical protein
MMLCGLQVPLKFLFGRVLGLMSSQRRFEYRQLLVRLEASEALDRFHHAGSGPTQAMPAFRHRFTLRQTRRTVPIMFSMLLVQASERRSCAGRPRRLTVSISSNAGRLLLEPAGEIAQQPLSLVSVVELPRLSERLARGGVQRPG